MGYTSCTRRMPPPQTCGTEPCSHFRFPVRLSPSPSPRLVRLPLPLTCFDFLMAAWQQRAEHLSFHNSYLKARNLNRSIEWWKFHIKLSSIPSSCAKWYIYFSEISGWLLWNKGNNTIVKDTRHLTWCRSESGLLSCKLFNNQGGMSSVTLIAHEVKLKANNTRICEWSPRILYKWLRDREES